MATAKDKPAGVEHRVDDYGNHSIGVTVDGHYVPFVTKDAVTVADAVERSKTVNGDNGNGDDGEGA